MLSTLIKEKTLTAHQQLEKKIIHSLKQMQSKEDYKDLLLQFYLFYKPLEDLVEAHIDHNHVFDYNLRRKSVSLYNDLKELGIQNIGKFAELQDLPPVKNHLHALGVLYVFEGSTLGGSIIANMVKTKTNLNNALSFFYGYETQTQLMWQRFQLFLNEPQLNNFGQETVINAAIDTFNTFNIFLEKNGRKEKL